MQRSHSRKAWSVCRRCLPKREVIVQGSEVNPERRTQNVEPFNGEPRTCKSLQKGNLERQTLKM